MQSLTQTRNASPDSHRKARVLSGIQATGSLHIGNYIGALSVWAANQQTYDSLFCIANLHSLTIPEAIEPGYLRERTLQTAALLMACGIDPKHATIFIQSDVPAHAYLAWLLDCVTPVGWLERMTQYKVKAANLESPSSGLLTYPVLQAADILIYQADYVPVGEDQKQHIELTRDIAQRFNRFYGEYFTLPQAWIRASGARIMGLDDPTVKMSKSVAEQRPAHAIALLDSPDTIRRNIMAAVTDSGNELRFDHASPGIQNLLVLYETLSGKSQESIEKHFGGRGYGYFKRETVDLVVETLRPIQERYGQIMSDPNDLNDVLKGGAANASAIADQTLAEVKQLVGLP